MHVGMHSPLVSVRRQFFHFMWVPEVEFGLGQQVLFLLNHPLLHFGVGHLTPLGLKVTNCDINTMMLTSPACLEKHIQSQGLPSFSSFMQCLLTLVLEESSVTLVDLYPYGKRASVRKDFSPSDESHPNTEREVPTVCSVEVEQGTKYLLWTTGTRGLRVSRSLSLILALLPSLEPWTHCFRSHLSMEKWAIHLPLTADEGIQ